LSAIFEISSRAKPILLQWLSYVLDFVSYFLISSCYGAVSHTFFDLSAIIFYGLTMAQSFLDFVCHF
jgi:hypothetical protein